MPKLIKKRAEKVGLPPGTLLHIGEKKVEEVRITIIDYDETHFQEKEVKAIEECLPFKDTPTITWINLHGIHEIEIIEKLGDYFGLHPLVQEDILNTDQRPKMDDFGDYIYVVLRMPYYDDKSKEVVTEQISLVFGLNFVISFEESEGYVFNPIRERIREGEGRIRKMKADYLAYTLIDAIVDNYFIILEKLGERIEDMEDELVTNPTLETLQGIHNLKREMMFLRKSVWPLREVLSGLERRESPLIEEITVLYIRDVYDHTIQIIDTIETLRDMLAGMLDIYLSSISNRMNAVMKVLTVIATIFMPLAFIVGIYGMNFRYMPELGWRWGYFVVWFIMIVTVGLMLIYFKKKKWL